MQNGFSAEDLWQYGKTEASLRFVREASAYIASSRDPIIIGALTDAIKEIKSGVRVLTEFTNPLKYLQEME